MEIKTLEVAGFIPAIKGMRNPKNSWYLIDSYRTPPYEGTDRFVLGANDLRLAQILITAGPEHCKFLRQIEVWADMNMPLYWWSEFDTYHFNTKNSCSTMHKLLDAKAYYSREMFEYLPQDEVKIDRVVSELNDFRDAFVIAARQTEKDEILKRAKSVLPSGFLQLRTVSTSYGELRNIYFQREHHKLKKEWKDTFCNWVETLPYSAELITFKPTISK